MTVYSAIYLSAAVVAAAAMVLAWRRRSSPGGLWLLLMLLAAAWWCFFDAMEASATGIPAHVLWAQVAYVGNMTVCTFLLLFSLEYTERRRLPGWALGALFVAPAVGVAAAATNGWRHLIWTDFSVVPGGMNLLAYSHGWLYLVVALYNYALVLLSIAILVGFALRARASYRRQSVAVIAAVAIPWAAEIVYLSNPDVLPGVDPSITLAISGALLVLALVRFRLLDLVPVVRHKLVERMEDGLLVLDTERRILDANPAAGRIIGGAREGWIGTDVRAALSAWPAVAEYLAGAVFSDGDTTIISAAGRSTTVSVVPLEDSRGAFSGSLVTLRDVTRQVATEAALRESEEKYRGIFDESIAAVYVFDSKKSFINTNQAGLDLLGYSREELLHMSMSEVDADPTVVLPAHQELLSGGRLINYEHRLRRKDGTIITVLNSSRPLTDLHGTVVGMLSTLIDITERKEAEAALRLSEDKFAKAFHGSPDAVLITAVSDGRVVEVNEGFTKLSGFERDEALGSSTIALDLWAEAGDRERCIAALQSDGSVSDMELGFRIRSGDVLRCLYAGALIEVDGEPHILSVVRDVTERKQAEEALGRSAAQLHEQLHDTVKAMGAIVGLRDPYTAAHERRVAALAAAIAVELGLDEEAREGLAFAAEVHDIGKIAVPAEILSKPGALSEVEYELIKQHSEAGRELLGAIHFRQPVAEIVAQHHERLDGSGYPRGLKGEEILLEARILAVADVVEAMASHRPYRPSLGLEAALAEVRAGAGSLYDAGVVAACERGFAQGFVFTDP